MQGGGVVTTAGFYFLHPYERVIPHGAYGNLTLNITVNATGGEINKEELAREIAQKVVETVRGESIWATYRL